MSKYKTKITFTQSTVCTMINSKMGAADTGRLRGTCHVATWKRANIGDYCAYIEA